MGAVTIEELTIADEPAAWAALGFDVEGEVCMLGAVRVRLTGHGQGAGIVGWSLRGLASTDLDGLPTRRSRRQAAERAQAVPPVQRARAAERARAAQRARAAHPNGVRAIDHVVAMTPELDRTVAALGAAGLDLRRIREQPTPAGVPRQAFFRLGEAILEVVQEPQEIVRHDGGAQRPARFWGLALLSDDLDATVASMAPHAREPRDAVQPGRRIATLARSAGLTVPVALMSAAARVGAAADV